LDKFIIDEVQEPQGDEAKEKYKKDMVREKTIIIDSIKDHPFYHVSSLYSPNQMMGTLTPLFEGSNIN
jgi:hypothetical protein